MMVEIFGSDGLFASLLSLGGITVPSRAKFIATTVATTTYSSLTFGLIAGQIGATIPSIGPLLPFLSGCWVGYTFGVYDIWRYAKSRAFYCAENYPKLLAHVMQVEFGLGVPSDLLVDTETTTTEETGGAADSSNTILKDNGEERTLSHWIMDGGIGRITTAVLAAQSCEGCIEEIEGEKRQNIVERNYKDSQED